MAVHHNRELCPLWTAIEMSALQIMRIKLQQLWRHNWPFIFFIRVQSYSRNYSKYIAFISLYNPNLASCFRVLAPSTLFLPRVFSNFPIFCSSFIFSTAYLLFTIRLPSTLLLYLMLSHAFAKVQSLATHNPFCSHTWSAKTTLTFTIGALASRDPVSAC